jgi:hypothetical protein
MLGTSDGNAEFPVVTSVLVVVLHKVVALSVQPVVLAMHLSQQTVQTLELSTLQNPAVLVSLSVQPVVLVTHLTRRTMAVVAVEVVEAAVQ